MGRASAWALAACLAVGAGLSGAQEGDREGPPGRPMMGPGGGPGMRGPGGFGGGRRGRGRGMGGGMMSSLMSSVVVGEIVDVNPVKGYVQVRTVPTGANRIVLIGDQTELTKLTETPLTELTVGEEVTVSGVPLQVHASSLRVGRALGMAELMGAIQRARQAFEPKGAEEEGESPAEGDEGAKGEEEGEAPEEEAAEGAEGTDDNGDEEEPAEEEAAPDVALERKAVTVTPRNYRLPETKVTGVVASTDPLTIAVTEELTVTISAAADAVLQRSLAATSEELTPGTQIVAFGVADDDNYLQAIEVRIGETIDFRSIMSAMGM